jgi:hypothetical protein
MQMPPKTDVEKLRLLAEWFDLEQNSHPEWGKNRTVQQDLRNLADRLGRPTLSTVNVIEIPDTSHMAVQQLVSFPDTPEGNKKAEALFIQLVNENGGPLGKDIAVFDEMLENGYYENGTYYVCLVHSTGDGNAKANAQPDAGTKDAAESGG